MPTKLLDFVVKADVQGSAEALSAAITELEASDDMLAVKTRVLRLDQAQALSSRWGKEDLKQLRKMAVDVPVDSKILQTEADRRRWEEEEARRGWQMEVEQQKPQQHGNLWRPRRASNALRLLRHI